MGIGAIDTRAITPSAVPLRKESRGPYTTALRTLYNQPAITPVPWPLHHPSPVPFSGTGALCSFPIARFPLPVIQDSDMESPIKTRKPRTRKPVNAQIEALKKSVSVALKAAWHVEAIKARREKAVRKERGALEKKVEEQREALKAIKASVDAFLVALTPAGQTQVETFAGPRSALDQAFGPGSTVVLDSSAPITPEGVAEFVPVDSAVSEGLVEQVAV